MAYGCTADVSVIKGYPVTVNNIECSEKNLIDFTIMGSSLYTSLYPNETPNVAILNIGSEELKGNEVIKETRAKAYPQLKDQLDKIGRAHV